MLAQRLPRCAVAAVDLSAALLAAARERQPAGGGPYGSSGRTSTACRSPDQGCDLVVAAFCLYHSPAPGQVIAEISPLPAPRRDGDHRVTSRRTATGNSTCSWPPPASTPERLHGRASTRPPTAATSYSSPPRSLSVQHVIHETHRFTFPASPTSPSTWPPHPSTSCPPWPGRRPHGLAAALRPAAARPAGHDDVRRHLPGRRQTPAGHRRERHYLKRYRDHAARQRAEANYRWLAGLPGPLRLPRLRDHQRPGTGVRAHRRAARPARQTW